LAQVIDHLGGQQILIVEDELIIAWELQSIVEALGGSALGPVPSVPAALELLGEHTPDAALLDVNLQGQMVTPVARECQRRNIPFAMVTGYGRLRLDEPLLELAPRVRKPFNLRDLTIALRGLLAASSKNAQP
jgi:CheY-like chemotaxis protein